MLPFHFTKIHLNIILPYLPGSSLRFPYQNPVYSFPLPISSTCLAYLILLDLITRTILGEEYRLLSTSICSSPHSPVTSSLLSSNILLSTLFSNTVSLLSSLNASDQVSCPYNAGGKIIVLYSLIVNYASQSLLNSFSSKHRN